MILIAYDGSEDAKCAIRHAGSLMSGQPAIVLTVWEPYTQILARTTAPFGMVAGVQDVSDIDVASRQSAEEHADEGTALGRCAGLDATPRVRPKGDSIADTILCEADRANASAIVVGTRGLSGLGSMLMGSVSHAVLQHADRPVIIVPSADVARRRNERRRAAVATPA